MVKLEIPVSSGYQIFETTSEKTITVRTTANDGISCIVPFTQANKMIPKSFLLKEMRVEPNQDLHFIHPTEVIVENRTINGVVCHIGNYVLLCRQMILRYLKSLHLNFFEVLPPHISILIREKVTEYGIITRFFKTGIEMKCVDSDYTFFVSNDEIKGSKVFTNEDELLLNHKAYCEMIDIIPGDYSTFAGIYRRQITSVHYNIEQMTNRHATFDGDNQTMFFVDDLKNIEKAKRPLTAPKAKIRISKDCKKKYNFCFFTRDQLSVIGCMINDFTIALEIIDPDLSTLIMARNRDETFDESEFPDRKRSRYT